MAIDKRFFIEDSSFYNRPDVMPSWLRPISRRQIVTSDTVRLGTSTLIFETKVSAEQSRPTRIS